MEAVILKALAKDPYDRYPTAAAMLDGIEIEAAPKSAVTTEAPKTGSSAPRKGRAGLGLAAVVGLLVVGLILLAVSLSQRGRLGGPSRGETVTGKEPAAVK